MARSAFLLAILALLTCSASSAKDTTKRGIPCKTPAIAGSCYLTHGRLGFGNGTPALRLWKIGTHRVLGVYSGPSAYNPTPEDRDRGDNENPELPRNVIQAMRPPVGANWFKNRIFANFKVCPLEPEKPAAMQAACIESAKNIVVEK